MAWHVFRDRTRACALDVVQVVRKLAPTIVCRTIGAQLLRSAASAAANYRAARRARTRKEFIAKLGIVEEEADESAFWLDLLVESGEAVPAVTLRRLEREADQLVAMTVSSIRTARARSRKIGARPIRKPQSPIRNE